MNTIRLFIPSMFHRRVLLLALATITTLALLASRLAWMTVEHGQENYQRAAQRLVTQTWLPTVRGSIYDRNGRVLAADRASYDIAIDYRILNGQWVYKDSKGRSHSINRRTYAARLARRANPQIWENIPQDEQQRIIDRFQDALDARVENMLRDIAQITSTPIEDIEQTVQGILARVGKIKDQHARRTYQAELEKFEARGYIATESDLNRFENIANQPIAEEVAQHPLVSDISDELGFAVLRLVSRTEPIINPDDAAIDPEQLQSLQLPLYPGLSVIDATARITPEQTISVTIDRSSFPPPLQSTEPVTLTETGIARMILGRVDTGLYKEDIDQRAQALRQSPQLQARALTQRGTDLGKYFTNDRVGRTAIERAHEHTLRGLRGVRIENLQTGAVEEILPQPGIDITLTLDIMLQARIRAILDPRLGLTRVQPWHHNEEPDFTPLGTELDAAAVVLDIASGEILALVSTPIPPTEDEWKSLGVNSQADQKLYNAIHSPWVNKAIAKPYPPGSVAKALILTQAAKQGVYSQGDRIHDRGYLLDGQPNKFRSWYYKKYNGAYGGHSDQLGRDLDGVDALMVSSNVFFFTLGRRLGPTGITQAYKDFGVSKPLDLGIGNIWPGSIGAFNAPNDGSDLNLDDATLMGIGQGPVTWTPLHAADAFATIARQGIHITPRLIRDQSAPTVTDINLPAWAVRDALAGLHEVVTNPQFGTGRAIEYEQFGPERVPIFNAPGIRVWGKTGTATAPNLLYDPDKEESSNGPLEPRVIRAGDHSWFVTLVAPEGSPPQYAIAVIVDYAGSGARVSGPINNQIIHALIEEGYLPDNAQSNTP